VSLVRREGDQLVFTVRTVHLVAAVVAVAGFGAGTVTGMIWASARATARGAARAQQGAAPPSRAADVAPPIAVATDGHPSRGPADATVTIVEFTDYECPFCRQHYQETFPRLMAAYDGRIRYVVRNFPLPTLHPGAVKAAEAVECAHLQGRFWDYRDALLRGTAPPDAAGLRRYAAQVGADTAAFGRCLDGDQTAPIVERDMREGTAYGVNGTPTFFINGRPITGAQTLESFTLRIDAALKAGARGARATR
jgi:protein-disulfide isomerase